MARVGNFLMSMLSNKSGSVSSKRVCGILIIVSVLYIYMYCTHTNNNVPEGVGELLIAGVTLLSTDSVTSIWKRPTNAVEH